MSRGTAGLIVGALLGLAVGWQVWGGSVPVVETPAVEVRQPDGSVVLERAPDAEAKPAHRIPKGTTLERTVTVTVQPDPVVHAPAAELRNPATPEYRQTGISPCSCAPVHVDLSLVREPNGMRRVVASARGGTILGGVDIPVESARQARVLRWGAGLTYDTQGAVGGFLMRDFDRLAFLRIPYSVGGAFVPGARPYGMVMVGLAF